MALMILTLPLGFKIALDLVLSILRLVTISIFMIAMIFSSNIFDEIWAPVPFSEQVLGALGECFL